MSKDDKGKREIHFSIDKEKFETKESSLSVRTLLVEYAKEDPSQTTLVLKQGNDLTKFTNLDEMVPMKNGMKFLVYHNSPTPVS